jgi:hypothetical protein
MIIGPCTATTQSGVWYWDTADITPHQRKTLDDAPRWMQEQMMESGMDAPILGNPLPTHDGLLFVDILPGALTVNANGWPSTTSSHTRTVGSVTIEETALIARACINGYVFDSRCGVRLRIVVKEVWVFGRPPRPPPQE